MPRIKNILINFLLMMGVIFFILIILEIVIIMLFGKMEYGQPVGLFKANPYYEYHFAPNINSTFNVPFSFNTSIITNSHGLRDKEITYENPLNKTRVLFLGDSVTECWGVDIDFCFIEILEKMFNNKTDSFEFINTGIRNYGTKLEYLYFKYEGYKYMPKYVVVSFSINDLKDNFQENSIVNGILNQAKSQSDLVAYVFSLAKKSSFFNFIYYYLGRKFKLDEIIKHYDNILKFSGKDYILDSNSREWNTTKDYLLKINDLCNDLGCRVIVQMPSTLSYYRTHPEDKDLNSEEFIVRNILQYFVENNNMSAVFILEELYPYAVNGTRMTFKTDGHYSELGNLIFANLTYPKLYKAVNENSFNVEQ